jgi:hypothetical protein
MLNKTPGVFHRMHEHVQGQGIAPLLRGDLSGKPVQVRFRQVSQYYRVGEVIANYLPTYLVLQVQLVTVISQQALQITCHQETFGNRQLITESPIQPSRYVIQSQNTPLVQSSSDGHARRNFSLQSHQVRHLVGDTTQHKSGSGMLRYCIRRIPHVRLRHTPHSETFTAHSDTPVIASFAFQTQEYSDQSGAAHPLAPTGTVIATKIQYRNTL